MHVHVGLRGDELLVEGLEVVLAVVRLDADLDALLHDFAAFILVDRLELVVRVLGVLADEVQY